IIARHDPNLFREIVKFSIRSFEKDKASYYISAETIPPKGLIAEFKDFISKYKVMGMAVAFIMGIYLGALVQSLVNDLLMPVIELATPGIPWEQITLGPFRIGSFLGALITFLIVAFVIFLIVKMTKKWGIE
ncbi:MAG: MscL family protein, partial [Candidatus Bathyarchaeia archaeon]